jgi:hypothetical protein
MTLIIDELGLLIQVSYCVYDFHRLREASRATRTHYRHVPHLQYSALDTEGKESVDKQDVVKSLASQGHGTYDEIRETLKDVQVDAT